MNEQSQMTTINIPEDVLERITLASFDRSIAGGTAKVRAAGDVWEVFTDGGTVIGRFERDGDATFYALAAQYFHLLPIALREAKLGRLKVT
jgi:hypothetical protein